MSGAPPQIDPTRPPEVDPLVGRTIAGKFAIEKLLGTGAMGAVYRARQIALDKTIAIKVLHRELAADKTFSERFHREAKAASRLDHPNSIRILDFGQEPDGLLYISMDYLDGRDLLEIINDSFPLGSERIVDILSQVLSALAVAHDLGILHRDLKPENIMVLAGQSDEGAEPDRVKVCDFGIAKMIDKDKDTAPGPALPKLSTVGHVVGTPAYMSPEQAKGDTVDARSDLYAVGVVLYQMLTKRVPFDAPSSISILYQHVNEQPIPPSFDTPNVDPRLEAICLKAMAKKPEQRYASARDMRAALRGLVDADSRKSPGLASGSSLAAADPTASLPLGPSPATSSTVDLPAFGLDARGRRRTLWIAGALAAVAIGGLLVWRLRAPPASTATLVTPIAPPLAQLEPVPQGNDRPEDRAAGHHGATAKAAPDPAPPAATAGAPHRPRRSKSSDSEDSDRRAQNGLVPSEPPPPPPATPPPVPPPRSAIAAPAAPIAPAPAPPFDPGAARVEIGSASKASGTTSTSVNKAMAPLAGKLTACYRSSLTQNAEATDGSGTLHIETNEDGVVSDARLSARVTPAAAQCIVAAVKGRKIANVDTGSASADVPLAFKSK